MPFPASSAATSPPSNSGGGVLSKAKLPFALSSLAALFPEHPTLIPSEDEDARVEKITSLRQPSYGGRKCKPVTSISIPQPRTTVAWRGAR
ncbi:hypothetical protein GN244_ATG00516 [Phytophthora infestans]|uniref:Uncharacterized protein n=1 Tax=Phytophthora infestans TaxID=4787 RepID=A0A833TUI2_PHYIN|nr:hypothetical protein GN244_ATG00516 [Phytophthora infestans]